MKNFGNSEEISEIIRKVEKVKLRKRKVKKERREAKYKRDANRKEKKKEIE